MEKKVVLKVNDISLSLNPFVKKMFDRIVSGMLDALDNVPQPVRKVTIDIYATDEEESQG